MQSNNDNYQVRFLKKLEDLLPTNVTLVTELVDLLGISMDSAYRRIRGETSLTFDEIIRLCKNFKVSFDSFISLESGNVTFNYTLMNEDEASFEKYLTSLRRDMKIISESKQKQIVYACEDITIFHQFHFHVISAFKMFYWMKSIMNVPGLQMHKFDIEHISEEFLNFGNEIYSYYCNIPSIEIWTDTTLQSTIKQIAFYWSSGNFKTTVDAIEVCESLRQELQYIQEQAELGTKKIRTERNLDDNNNFVMYFSDIEITTNCVLVKMGDNKAVYLGHLSFNTMSTSDSVYCNETEMWLNNLIKKSIPISGVSEKHRYQFFKNAYNQIDELIERIKS
jgi:plasmid maintenance system antidote protein VapI